MRKEMIFLVLTLVIFTFLIQSCGLLPQKLCPPSNLRVEKVGPDFVVLEWDDNTISEEGFEIYRSDDGVDGEFVKISVVDMNSECFKDMSVLPTRRYVYKVRAFKRNCFSGFSNPVEVMTMEAYPLSPQNLRVVDKTEKTVELSWFDRANNEDGFRIFRSMDGENYEIVKILPRNSVHYVDENLQSNTIYYYYIKAFNRSGDSERSNIIVVQTNGINDPPSISNDIFPRNGAENIDFNSVTLRWGASDPNGDELIYNLYFGTEPIPPLKEEGLITPYFTVSNLIPNTTYYWKISAYDKHGNTVYSYIWSFRTKSNISSFKDKVFSSSKWTGLNQATIGR